MPLCYYSDIELVLLLNSLYQSPQKLAWKSPSQLSAVKLLLQNSSNNVVILPTGGGKTTVYALTAFIENNRFLTVISPRPTQCVTVVVLPLVILMADQFRKLKAHSKLRVVQWLPSSLAVNQDGIPLQDSVADIVLVSLEHATSPNFIKWISLLGIRGLLRRIVFDEVHLVLEQQFRRSVDQIWMLRGNSSLTHVPVCLFTATLPPERQRKLLEAFHCAPESTRIWRCATDRPNIAYQVLKKNSADEVVNECVELINDFVVESAKKEKAIIFASTIADVEKVVLLLAKNNIEALKYVGTSDAEDKCRIWDSFVHDDNKSVLVGTHACGLGADYGHIRKVYYIIYMFFFFFKNNIVYLLILSFKFAANAFVFIRSSY
jgi:superfamily II DNA helicase RecQ